MLSGRNPNRDSIDVWDGDTSESFHTNADRKRPQQTEPHVNRERVNSGLQAVSRSKQLTYVSIAACFDLFALIIFVPMSAFVHETRHPCVLRLAVRTGRSLNGNIDGLCFCHMLCIGILFQVLVAQLIHLIQSKVEN